MLNRIKRLIIIWVLLAFSFVLCNPYIGLASSNPVQQQRTHESGTVLYVGGLGPGNFSSIQNAVDNATAGDTIFVYNDSSPYYENLKVTVPVTILGEDKQTTIIDGMNQDHVISVIADEVHLSGFTIQYGGSYWSNIGIHILGYDNLIENNIIIHNANGIFIEGTMNNTIKNNLITTNVFHAIRLEYAAYNTINNNYALENNNGIYLWEAPENIIMENTLDNNRWEGVIIGEYSDGNMIYHNNFLGEPEEHAYDLSNNSWDDGYPTGGNYWQDYQGVDENEDGIGDTPYEIRGAHAVDRYPLMKPYGLETPTVTVEIMGGIGCTITIKDLRENSSIPLQVDISCNYLYVLRPLILADTHPLFHVQVTKTLQFNNQIFFKDMPPLLLGFGKVIITVQMYDIFVSEEKQIVSMFVLPS